jgi:hypothetical protein
MNLNADMSYMGMNPMMMGGGQNPNQMQMQSGIFRNVYAILGSLIYLNHIRWVTKFITYFHIIN